MSPWRQAPVRCMSLLASKRQRDEAQHLLCDGPSRLAGMRLPGMLHPCAGGGIGTQPGRKS
jgi:hypothetical protein